MLEDCKHFIYDWIGAYYQWLAPINVNGKHETDIKDDSKSTYNVTLRSVRIFESCTFFTDSHITESAGATRSVDCCSQMYTLIYYKLLLSLGTATK